MEDKIIMSKQESDRRDIIAKAVHGSLKQTEASILMNLSYRQTNRLVRNYQKHGATALIHKSRGTVSQRKIPPHREQRILNLYQQNYPDFGPTFACEKLRDIHHIRIGKETLRKLLIKNHLWTSRKHSSQQCHVWRERKHHRGELIQVDGSHHRWLENRLNQEICLMAYIDDATGEVFARFYEYEGTFPFLDSLQRFIKKRGIPCSLYLDRHSTYVTTRQSSVDEQLRNEYASTQAARVIKELDVQPIWARSPQAKGRVERLFQTLQDRLVKDMRLSKIRTIEAANGFLETYLVAFNKQFTVPPKENASLFKPVPKDFDYKWTFAIREIKVISSGYTIRWQNRIFLVNNPSLSLKGKKVEIKQALDGSLRFATKNKIIRTSEITEKDIVRARLNCKQLKKFAHESRSNKSKKSWMDKKYIGTSMPFSQPYCSAK